MNVCRLWIIFPPCVAATNFLLELRKVLNSHGIGEQALAILCPKKKNMEMADRIVYNPILKNELLQVVDNLTFSHPM